MSTVNVTRRLLLDPEPDRVWAHMIRPERVVLCLPGAELTESSEDGRVHEGSVTVKLGPLGVSYRGTAEFVEVDHDARRLRVKGKGREKTGAGAVSMEVLLEVAGVDDRSEVRIDATVQLAGKIVTFGRGMIDAVTEDVLDAFAECLRRTLGSGGSAETGVDAPSGQEAYPSGTAPPDAASTPPVEGLRIRARAILRWIVRSVSRS